MTEECGFLRFLSQFVVIFKVKSGWWWWWKCYFVSS